MAPRVKEPVAGFQAWENDLGLATEALEESCRQAPYEGIRTPGAR